MNVHKTPLNLDKKQQKMTTKNLPNPILETNHEMVTINFNVVQNYQNKY
jgi:hypothetical protein